MASALEQQPPMQPPATGAILRRAAPRLLRDGFGPLAIFFAGWKLIGLAAGIGMAVLFGVAVFTHERRAGRPAMIVRVALVLVLLRGVVGLSSGSARVYLAQEVAMDTLISGIVLGLLAKGRPLATVFAREIYPLPQEMSESPTFSKAMVRITAVWGIYFLARAMVRLVALLTLTTDHYVLVSALSDAPFLIAILAWSVRYTGKAFRNSEQWAPVIVRAEALAARSPSAP
jgi:intracellular septation protein A